MSEKVWECKIGGFDIDYLPDGSDLPMRQAVQEAFSQITGKEATFTFSGWNAELTPMERQVATTKSDGTPRDRVH